MIRVSVWYTLALMGKPFDVVFVAILVALCGAVAGEARAQSLNSYHIGNSLTWDSRPDFGLPKLATDAVEISVTTTGRR